MRHCIDFDASANNKARFPISNFRSLLRILNILKWLLVAITFSLALSSNVQASGNGVKGWLWDGVYYDSAVEACVGQWKWAGMNSGLSRFIGAFPRTDSITAWNCEWTRFQYLCPQENNIGGIAGIGQCGTVNPSIVTFDCEQGFTVGGPGPFCVPLDDDPLQRPPCGFDSGGKKNPIAGNPIILRTGTKILEADDYVSADGRFQLARRYRSAPVGLAKSVSKLPVGLGTGWQFNFEMELQLGTFLGTSVNPVASLSLITPDGSAYDFTLQDNGSWKPDTTFGSASSDYRIVFGGVLPNDLTNVKKGTSEWTVTGPDEKKWTLKTFQDPNSDPSRFVIARPTQILERDGYSWKLDYAVDGRLNSISDSFQRTASFVWNAFNVSTLPGVSGAQPIPVAVSRVSLPDATTINYTFDPSSTPAGISPSISPKLTKVQWFGTNGAEVNSTSYHYENPVFSYALTGITDHRNVRTATYAYDNVGRAVSTEGADGSNKYTVEYTSDGAGTTRRVTNPLGRKTTYRFERVGSYPVQTRLVGVDGEASPNCPVSAKSYAYGSYGSVSSETDEEGRVTSYLRDTLGRPTQINVAAGTPNERMTSVIWHPTLNKPTKVSDPNLTTDYTYNTLGQLVSVTETDITNITVPYATYGRSRTWNYTFEPTGLLLTIDGPLQASKVSYTYDAAGYVATFTDALGHVTKVNASNGRGEPTEIVDPNGLITALTYDAIGRLTRTIADPSGVAANTVIEYDAAGNVTKITQPNGAFFAYTYDSANRILEIRDNLNQTIKYTYDTAGNVLTDTRTNEDVQFKQTNSFDELGRILQTIGVDARTWKYAHDKVGNLLSITDPNGKPAAYSYDSLNRVISFADEAGNTTKTGYGSNRDGPQSVKDPRNIQTSYVRNGWGEVIQETSPDIGTTSYNRDDRGLITQRTDARGQITQRAYDNGGRLSSVSYPSEPGSNTVYTYDSIVNGNKGIDKLTGVTDAVGTVSFSYDLLGRVVQESRVLGSRTYTTSYAWDAAGKLIGITYPSGRVVNYGRNENGNIGSVSTRKTSTSADAPLANWIGRAPFGPRIGIGYGNGLSDWRVLDTDGRITALRVYNDPTNLSLIAQVYLYNDKRNITSVIDQVSPANNEFYVYTPNGYMQEADGPWGSLNYVYDGSGNITHKISTQGAVQLTSVSGIPADSNRLTSVMTNGVLARELTVDAAGNRTVDKDTQSGSMRTHRFDAAGNLASSELGAIQRGKYSYDYKSRLVKRENGVFNTQTLSIYDLFDNLIAEYDAAGLPLREYVWLEDRPLAVVDNVSSATPTILQVHTDHLERPIMMTDMNQQVVWKASYLPFGEVRQITGSKELNNRFPGQWFQMETGLHYNWHRHYDPTTGRYLQPDPLGMPDGPNRWAYALNSPLMNVDPEGLLAASQVWRLWNVYIPFQPRPNYCEAPPITPDFIKPPKDAEKPDGAKAPGYPGGMPGYADPKGGPNWVPNPNPKGKGYGWEAKDGKVWVPSGQGGSLPGTSGPAHGGPHWDVQDPKTGGRENIFPPK